MSAWTLGRGEKKRCCAHSPAAHGVCEACDVDICPGREVAVWDEEENEYHEYCSTVCAADDADREPERQLP